MLSLALLLAALANPLANDPHCAIAHTQNGRTVTMCDGRVISVTDGRGNVRRNLPDGSIAVDVETRDGVVTFTVEAH